MSGGMTQESSGLGAQVPGVCSWEGGAEKKLREDGEEVVAKPEREEADTWADPGPGPGTLSTPAIHFLIHMCPSPLSFLKENYFYFYFFGCASS